MTRLLFFVAAFSDGRSACQNIFSNDTRYGSDLLQGSAKKRAPGSMNEKGKNCVFLPAAGRRTQFFIIMFSELGVCGFADPCNFT